MTLKDSIEKSIEINEATFKELKSNASSSVKGRVNSQKLKVTYIGVDKRGIAHFKTTSGTMPGRYWEQLIRFDDLPDARKLKGKDKKLKDRDAINLVIYGNISVSCNDTSFKHYWSYMAWTQKYGLTKEIRYPKVRNPKLKGSVCKHLLAVFDVLPFYIGTITKDLRKRGLI